MKLRSLAAIVLVAACSHGEPFGVPGYGGSRPLGGMPVVPYRLTYSTLNDSEASWLPDGSSLLYSALRSDFADTTYCLELLPPGGGQVSRSWCPTGSAPPDSSRAFQAGAVSPGGRLLYLRSARTAPNVGWSVRQLVLADVGGAAAPRVLLRTPFPQYTGLSQIRWLTEDRFVFRADLYAVNFPQGYGLPYESSTGLFLVAGRLAGDSAVFTQIPGTMGATSVAVADSDTIFYTLQGNPTVYSFAMSTGAMNVVRGFPGIADAVQVSGRRVALTVDGLVVVTSLDSPLLDTLDSGVYSGLALSPDGRRLVAQQHGDLYEFLLP